MTEPELVGVLSRFSSVQISLSPYSYLVAGLVTLFSAGLGAFISSYLKRTGEISAVTSRLEETVVQLQRQTHAVEEVKSEISSRAWVEQQKWEFRRDLYLELIEGILAIRSRCLKGEEKLDKVSKVVLSEEDDDDRLDRERERVLSEAEAIYDIEVHDLTENFKQLVNKKGLLFLDDAVVKVLDCFFNAEKIRRENSWVKFKEDVVAGLATPYDHNCYDSYEISLYYKSEAATAAYKSLLAAAKKDLKIAG